MKINWKIILHKLLVENISDPGPRFEGHLINHMNESLESDLNNYSSNVTSQTKYENTSILTITQVRQKMLTF